MSILKGAPMKKQETKADKERTIEQARREEYFLPKYSDYYFEKQKAVSLWSLLGYVYVSIIFLLIIAESNDLSASFVWICLAIIGVGVLYLCVLKKYINQRKMLYGAQIMPEGIVVKGAWGYEHRISYYDLQQEIAQGHMKYADTGIELGKGKNKLTFHYEIGDSAAQKHVKKCYAQLQKYIIEKLIPYEKQGLELLDKRYFYAKSRRRYLILLGVASFIFFVFVRAGVIVTILGAVIYSPMIGGLEYFGLFRLSKNAVLTMQNYDKMQQMLEEHPKMQFRGKYVGWIGFLVAAVLVLLWNLWLVCTI